MLGCIIQRRLKTTQSVGNANPTRHSVDPRRVLKGSTTWLGTGRNRVTVTSWLFVPTVSPPYHDVRQSTEIAISFSQLSFDRDGTKRNRQTFSRSFTPYAMLPHNTDIVPWSYIMWRHWTPCIGLGHWGTRNPVISAARTRTLQRDAIAAESDLLLITHVGFVTY